MDAPPIKAIAAQGEPVQAALRDLNNANARETSFLTCEAWRALIAGVFSATCVPDAAALLITFDQDAGYDSPNFKWFQARHPRFVYVDRIVVSGRHRGKGLATLLYRDLFERARVTGHDRIVCEVNLEPPNPGSDAFHTKLGFAEVGCAELEAGEKWVRYYEKLI